jgi:hypothetical protein
MFGEARLHRTSFVGAREIEQALLRGAYYDREFLNSVPDLDPAEVGMIETQIDAQDEKDLGQIANGAHLGLPRAHIS